ncbi:T9SS type A sorting domain-containing protein [Winogradskyella sp. SM1960]|uniref:T9SS type A sorting domain-containing protein n=1 Tax=Winogradskyella sp. SM1960 TaxID=2865955 RepID=UPI001CD20221|nr:T9SS type A sorting domain-containing protein [Winogradskyella sp. SM1960]
MKKITLAIALLTLGVQAQTFPAPYCEITSGADVSVEEITSVSFAGTIITNSDDVTVLIDKTATVVNIEPGETYSLEVEGNTYGVFETNIVAFIDWNQNDILDDEGEIYEVGALFDTDGADDQPVSLDITVPENAVTGETRIRLTKTYTDFGGDGYPASPAEIDSCGIMFDVFGMGIEPGYGQALDFTLNLAPLSVDEFEQNALAVYPNPAKDVLNIDYKSALTAVKIYNIVGQEVLHMATTSSQVQLDVSEFTSGIYIVKLFAEEGQHSFRVVKD